MFGGRLRAMLGDQISSRPVGAARSPLPDVPASVEEVYSRPSHGLDQFFTGTSDLQGFPMLDLSGASQANISYITQLGIRLYSDDTMLALETAFGNGPARWAMRRRNARRRRHGADQRAGQRPSRPLSGDEALA